MSAVSSQAGTRAEVRAKERSQHHLTLFSHLLIVVNLNPGKCEAGVVISQRGWGWGWGEVVGWHFWHLLKMSSDFSTSLLFMKLDILSYSSAALCKHPVTVFHSLSAASVCNKKKERGSWEILCSTACSVSRLQNVTTSMWPGCNQHHLTGN